MTKLWQHQTAAVRFIMRFSECLVHHCCGSGKTVIQRVLMGRLGPSQIGVVVVPWLALARQMQRAFESTLSVAVVDSEHHASPLCRHHRLYIVTYQSLGVLTAHLERWALRPDLCCLDEAHHAEADAWGASVRRLHPRRTVLFTATPTEGQRTAFSGRTHRFTHAQAVAAGVNKPFELVVRVVPRGLPGGGLYEAVAHAAVKYGCTRIIVFHAYSNDTDRGSCVEGFDAELLRRHFRDAGCARVAVHKLTARHSQAQRDRMFDEFRGADDGVQVISNCRVIQEGFDVPQTDMVVFADPKRSYAAIEQAIGRVTRTGRAPTGYVLVPVEVDLGAYRAAATPAERSAIVSGACAQGGDFRPVVEVAQALKYNDHEVAWTRAPNRTRGTGTGGTGTGAGGTRSPHRVTVTFDFHVELQLELDTDLVDAIGTSVVHFTRVAVSVEEYAGLMREYSRENGGKPPPQGIVVMLNDTIPVNIGQKWHDAKRRPDSPAHKALYARLSDLPLYQAAYGKAQQPTITVRDYAGLMREYSRDNDGKPPPYNTVVLLNDTIPVKIGAKWQDVKPRPNSPAHKALYALLSEMPMYQAAYEKAQRTKSRNAGKPKITVKDYERLMREHSRDNGGKPPPQKTVILLNEITPVKIGAKWNSVLSYPDRPTSKALYARLSNLPLYRYRMILRWPARHVYRELKRLPEEPDEEVRRALREVVDAYAASRRLKLRGFPRPYGKAATVTLDRVIEIYQTHRRKLMDSRRHSDDSHPQKRPRLLEDEAIGEGTSEEENVSHSDDENSFIDTSEEEEEVPNSQDRAFIATSEDEEGEDDEFVAETTTQEDSGEEDTHSAASDQASTTTVSAMEVQLPELASQAPQPATAPTPEAAPQPEAAPPVTAPPVTAPPVTAPQPETAPPAVTAPPVTAPQPEAAPPVTAPPQPETAPLVTAPSATAAATAPLQPPFKALFHDDPSPVPKYRRTGDALPARFAWQNDHDAAVRRRNVEFFADLLDEQGVDKRDGAILVIDDARLHTTHILRARGYTNVVCLHPDEREAEEMRVAARTHVVCADAIEFLAESVLEFRGLYLALDAPVVRACNALKLAKALFDRFVIGVTFVTSGDAETALLAQSDGLTSRIHREGLSAMDRSSVKTRFYSRA